MPAIINNITRRKFDRSLLACLKELIQNVLAKHGSKKKLISISFVSPSKIKELNKKFRRIDRPTDVLSFTMDEENILGDVIICPSIIEKNARTLKVDIREEYIRMAVHGALHLLGYDHVKKKDRIAMFAVQEGVVHAAKTS